MAAAAGIDSVDYRLARLTDPRAIAVLKRAAEMIGLADASFAQPSRRAGQHADGPRRGLHALQAGRELRGDRDGSGRRSSQRRKSACGA